MNEHRKVAEALWRQVGHCGEGAAACHACAWRIEAIADALKMAAEGGGSPEAIAARAAALELGTVGPFPREPRIDDLEDARERVAHLLERPDRWLLVHRTTLATLAALATSEVDVRERCAAICDADARAHDESADALLAVVPRYQFTPQEEDSYQTHRECARTARNFASRIRSMVKP